MAQNGSICLRRAGIDVKPAIYVDILPVPVTYKTKLEIQITIFQQLLSRLRSDFKEVISYTYAS